MTEEKKIGEDGLTPASRRIAAITALAFGGFTVFIAPFLIQVNMSRLIETVLVLGETNPMLKLTPIFIFTWTNITRGIGVVAGIALMIMAIPLLKGEKWAWSAALSFISLPTIYSILIALPYVVQCGFPPPAGICIILGVVAFWIMIVLKEGSKTEKRVRLLVLTTLGVIAGHVNVLIMHGIKGTIDTGFDATVLAPREAVYGFEVPINFVVMVLCMIAIPLVANKKEAGWWMCLVIGFSLIIANVPPQVIRMETVDFIFAAIFGAVLIVSVSIPKFKQYLVE